MKSSADVQAEFTSKIKALVAEYKADVQVEDISNGWESPNDVISVFIPTVYDANDNIVSDSASFNLGSFI